MSEMRGEHEDVIDVTPRPTAHVNPSEQTRPLTPSRVWTAIAMMHMIEADATCPQCGVSFRRHTTQSSPAADQVDVWCPENPGRALREHIGNPLVVTGTSTIVAASDAYKPAPGVVGVFQYPAQGMEKWKPKAEGRHVRCSFCWASGLAKVDKAPHVHICYCNARLKVPQDGHPLSWFWTKVIGGRLVCRFPLDYNEIPGDIPLHNVVSFDCPTCPTRWEHVYYAEGSKFACICGSVVVMGLGRSNTWEWVKVRATLDTPDEAQKLLESKR